MGRERGILIVKGMALEETREAGGELEKGPFENLTGDWLCVDGCTQRLKFSDSDATGR